MSKKLLECRIVDVSALNGTTFDLNGKESIKQSIIDTLYHSDLNLSELVNNAQDAYGLRAWLEKENTKTAQEESVYSAVEQLSGSKAIKRGVTQSLKVLDDIVRAMGYEPTQVFIEFARETQASRNPKTRQDQLIKKFEENEDFKDILKQLKSLDAERFKDEKVYLYFLQNGKDA